MYREHWALVCGFLLRRTRDPHLAEDLAQETFVKATRALLGWRGENADFFGHVGRLPLGNGADTTLSRALANVSTGNQPKGDSRKVLARLPEELNALAVIEFAKPLTTDELSSFTARYRSSVDKVVYERRPSSIPITWGGMTTWDRAPMPELTTKKVHVIQPDEAIKLDLANFRRWVGILKDYDDDNLHDFDLSLARLRKAANDGLAYAYVDSLATIGELRKIRRSGAP
ncbi:sigma factor [Nonomuraea sp. NPDC049158]|uniref:RNA polymerase sigma factor n=1 Tax=Nonomuraea sp. NPDC049158 TaxID=3155649 RepID=UPI00340A3766